MISIFCENKRIIQDIHEFLLMKGVDAICVYKDHEKEGIPYFRNGKCDVLVTTVTFKIIHVGSNLYWIRFQRKSCH